MVQNSLVGNSTRASCGDGDLVTPLALFYQFSLGAIAFLFLIVKRQCEPREVRRGWLVWFCDITKQGWSVGILHFMNIALAENKNGSIDPCTYYLATFGVDSTIGLIIIYIGVKCCERLCQSLNILDGLEFGEYFKTEAVAIQISPRVVDNLESSNFNRLRSATSTEAIELKRELEHRSKLGSFSCQSYSVQLACYLIVTMVLKVIVYFILKIEAVDHLFLKIRELFTFYVSSKESEIFIVLFLVPLILNIIMLWVTDSILMHGETCADVIKKFIRCHTMRRCATNERSRSSTISIRAFRKQPQGQSVSKNMSISREEMMDTPAVGRKEAPSLGGSIGLDMMASEPQGVSVLCNTSLGNETPRLITELERKARNLRFTHSLGSDYKDQVKGLMCSSSNSSQAADNHVAL